MTDTQEMVDELESAKNWLDLISEKFREGNMLDEAAKTDRPLGQHVIADETK